MVRVPRYHQHKRLYQSALLVTGINFKADLGILVDTDAIFQFNLVDFLMTVS